MRSKGNWIDKLERKFGKYAIPDLMKYLSLLYIVGFLLCYSGIYTQYLALDFGKIFQGQVWRLVTFIVYPPQLFTGSALSILFVVISIALYLMIGRSLENAWGAFRFNLYYFTGIFACILSGLISYLILGANSGILITTDYVFQTMFLAFALMFPDIQLMLMLIIPVKMKWLGILYGALILVDLFENIKFIISGYPIYVVNVITIVLSMLNFIVLFISMKRGVRVNPVQRKKSKEYKKKISNTLKNRTHTCAFCGVTDKENPDMEFRYCSRCDGNKEYCMDHLFTHEHVKKIVVNINKDK